LRAGTPVEVTSVMHTSSPATTGDVDGVRELRRRLRDAADPRAITDDVVRVYCVAMGRDDHRMEAALLRQARAMVDVDALVDGVVTGELAEPPRAVLDRLLPNRRRARIRRLYWARLRAFLTWRAR
jgi:hypothetical protein